MLYLRLLIAAFLLQGVAALPAAAEKRVALVIGNSAYLNAGTLSNPANDATDTAKVLNGFGFDVILGLDLTRPDFEQKVRAFSHALESADAAVLFYAGHGLQVGGKNYLLPVDAKLSSERDLDFEAVSLDFVLKQMEVGRDGKINIVFLDACRDNPLSKNLARSMGTRSVNVGQGLAEVQTGVGTFIAYSTQPGNVALDGEGRNSPFTAAFAKHVQEPGRNLTAIMIDVRKDVLAVTGGAASAVGPFGAHQRFLFPGGRFAIRRGRRIASHGFAVEAGQRDIHCRSRCARGRARLGRAARPLDRYQPGGARRPLEQLGRAGGAWRACRANGARRVRGGAVRRARTLLPQILLARPLGQVPVAAHPGWSRGLLPLLCRKERRLQMP